jgi:hypothetical protein
LKEVRELRQCVRQNFYRLLKSKLDSTERTLIPPLGYISLYKVILASPALYTPHHVPLLSSISILSAVVFTKKMKLAY